MIAFRWGGKIRVRFLLWQNRYIRFCTRSLYPLTSLTGTLTKQIVTEAYSVDGTISLNPSSTVPSTGHLCRHKKSVGYRSVDVQEWRWSIIHGTVYGCGAVECVGSVWDGRSERWVFNVQFLTAGDFFYYSAHMLKLRAIYRWREIHGRIWTLIILLSARSKSVGPQI
jgi:hypothetical protein